MPDIDNEDIIKEAKESIEVENSDSLENPTLQEDKDKIGRAHV